VTRVRSETRAALILSSLGVLALLGLTAVQEQWWARARAERTALAYARAVYQLDTAAPERISVSGSAHHSLCAGRWSLRRAWGQDAHLRVLRRVAWRDTLHYYIGNDVPTPVADTFVFRIVLAWPDKVVTYDVPSLFDSATAAGFHRCTGWFDWPRVRRAGSQTH
jgi:hypothetical protein